MAKKKEWKVEFSPQALRKLNNIPDKEYEELSKGIKGFIEKIQSGKSPAELGSPIKPLTLEKKLLCGTCRSRNIEWWMDDNSKEVYYSCEACGESAWMTEEEYKKALEEYPELVFEDEK